MTDIRPLADPDTVRAALDDAAIERHDALTAEVAAAW